MVGCGSPTADRVTGGSIEDSARTSVFLDWPRALVPPMVVTAVLPQTFSALTGLRAALWVRESTAGQFDAFGPDSQREQYARALERWGLLDTGVEWTVSHSGWRIASHPAWAEMLGQAGETFDVLVVGYASRFARSLEAHVDARRAFHAAGAAILFADERILSSDESAWESWAREALEAEAYSRRLSRRVREGLATKRRRLGTPGGNRPALGFRREGRPPILVADEERLAVVRRAFVLSAGGMRDREVAAQIGLKVTHLREVLTNPIYRGRLRTGEPAATPPVIDPALWDQVQETRRRWARRNCAPVRHRGYALSSILHCAACGRRLTGDTGRYRHVEPCEPFLDAKVAPRRRFAVREIDHRHQGHSYPIAAYDEIAERALEHVALGAKVKTEVIARAAEQEPDGFTLARIERDREVAALRYAKDRDLQALNVALERLDAEEAEARERPVAATAAEIAEYLADLPRLWRETDDEGRRLLAQALFDRIDVLGMKRATVHPSPAAEQHGFRDAWEASGSFAESGRGERT